MDHLAKERADDDDFGRRLAKNELNRLFKLSVCLSVCPSVYPLSLLRTLARGEPIPQESRFTIPIFWGIRPLTSTRFWSNSFKRINSFHGIAVHNS